MDAQSHAAQVIDQFTKQAVPFAKAPSHEEQIDRMIALAGVTSEDQVLDVCCGPGLVATAFARVARHVTGIDLTPEMIAQAQRRQVEHAVANMRFEVGDATALPFEDGTFDIVVTRYSLHHVLEALAVVREMARVCRPGGRVLVVDATPRADAEMAFNAAERLRDPSHVRALPPEELAALIPAAGLRLAQADRYELPMAVDALLAHSFSEDSQRFREAIARDIGVDALDFSAHRRADGDWVVFKIGLVLGLKL